MDGIRVGVMCGLLMEKCREESRMNEILWCTY